MLIFEGPSCEGPAKATGTVAELESPGLSVRVPYETAAEFSALVETPYNESPCSEPITYTDTSEPPDKTPPPPPVLSSTAPASPAVDAHPKIVGSAEAGSTVRIYAGEGCGGSAVAVGTATELWSPGIIVSVTAGTTAKFSATATDAAGNTSSCSSPISFTDEVEVDHSKVNPESQPTDPTPPTTSSPTKRSSPVTKATSCTVPKLVGKTLARAKAALKGAHCSLGKVAKARQRAGKSGALVVASSGPAAGAKTAGAVSLRLAPRQIKR